MRGCVEVDGGRGLSEILARSFLVSSFPIFPYSCSPVPRPPSPVRRPPSACLCVSATNPVGLKE